MTRLAPALVVSLALGALAAGLALGKASGSPGGYSSAPGESSCISCHGGFPLGSGALSISGPASLAGASALPMQVSWGNTAGSSFGFELAALNSAGGYAGTWTITDAANTKKIGPNTTHTSAGHLLKTWGTQWNVPVTLPAGPVTFYASGVQGNGSGSGGDHVQNAVFKVYQAGLSSPSSTWPVGGLYPLNLNAPKNPGQDYILALSSGVGPSSFGGFQVPIDLSSGWVSLSLSTPALFQNFIGTLNGAGQAQANVFIPAIPVLAGLNLHFAYLTFQTGTATVTEVSNRFSATLQ